MAGISPLVGMPSGEIENKLAGATMISQHQVALSVLYDLSAACSAFGHWRLLLAQLKSISGVSKAEWSQLSPCQGLPEADFGPCRLPRGFCFVPGAPASAFWSLDGAESVGFTLQTSLWLRTFLFESDLSACTTTATTVSGKAQVDPLCHTCNVSVGRKFSIEGPPLSNSFCFLT